METVHSSTEEGLVRGCSCRGGNGFAHVSCLARQAQVAFERSNTFDRWTTCGLCEQRYHGVVACALGWACWKTYVGRPRQPLFRPTTSLRPFEIYITSKKRGRCYVKRYPWRKTFSEKTMLLRS